MYICAKNYTCNILLKVKMFETETELHFGSILKRQKNKVNYLFPVESTMPCTSVFWKVQLTPLAGGSVG